MGKFYDTIDGKLRDWIERQSLFFVATAPTSANGHVNVSPKGPIETFRVVDERRIAYLDFVGSGAETVAHLRENGRIVVMFCAFEGRPRILRLHGFGYAVQRGDERFREMYEALGFSSVERVPGSSRAIVVVEVERISDSCGYGVPLLRYEGRRPQQVAWFERKTAARGTNALARYVAERNAESIDALPAFDGTRAGEPARWRDRARQ